MKKAKKIFGMLAAFAMVFAYCTVLTGCGDELTPEEKYDAAQKNLRSADDISLKDGAITAKVDMGGQSMEIKMDVDADIINDKDDPMNMQMAMNAKTSLFGQSADMHMYMKDKTTYTDTNGTKTKAPMDEESIKQIQKYINNGGGDVSIAEYVTESSEEDGVVTLKLDAEKMVKDALGKLDEADADSEQIKEAEKAIAQTGLKTITAKAKIEGEEFKDLEYSTTLDIDPALLGMGADTTPQTTDRMKIDITVRFGEIKTNTGLKIDFPDFSDYKETGI